MLRNLRNLYCRRFCTSPIQSTSEIRKVENKKRIGLLSSISDITVAHHYSDNINITDYTAKEMRDEKNLYKVFSTYWNNDSLKFDKNLKNIIEVATKFVESKDLWNREKIKSKLDTIVNGKSNFVCLLAGKSTGKSLIVKYLQDQYKEKVFVVNLRQNLNMLKGLIDTLENHESLVTQLTAKFGAITLIIDEANLAFNITSGTSKSEILAAKQALALFTTLTKEKQKVFM